MVFSSELFLFYFLPAVLVIYYFIHPKLKNVCLALASFIFYAWSGLEYAIIILISTAVNFAIGRFIGEKTHKNPLYQKQILIIGVIFNLALIGYFKYFNFFAENIENAIKVFNPGFSLRAPIIPLPIGISFFTFQILSYVIDVYRGTVKPQKNIINLALYNMMFPQLIAGPIVRYADVAGQITERRHTIDKTHLSIRRFIIGLCKKVILADGLGKVADNIFGASGNVTTGAAWFGVFCYAFQIYYDFSGYSDMAIGLGKLLGFDFNENFIYPYISKSIREFWRRWHISLSTWFRDYLYIPLGGNKKSLSRTYLNLLIVFFITGLWHGAGWNFVVWGLFHGVFLVLERGPFGRFLDKIPSIFARIYTMFIVLVGWVFFRSEALGAAGGYMARMFMPWQAAQNTPQNANIFNFVELETIFIFCICLLFSVPIAKYIKDGWAKITNKIPALLFPVTLIADTGYIALLFVCVLYIAGSTFSPFIYFRF